MFLFRRTMIAAVMFAGHLWVAPSAAPAPIFTTLHSFQAKPDAAIPDPYLVADQNGVLYGAGYGGVHNQGALFSLTPPTAPGGAWMETVLHSFTSGRGGSVPNSPLALGPDGALYGTTYSGGSSAGNCASFGCGTAFRLMPASSPGGEWKFSVLYTFTDGSDGGVPSSGLVRGSNGVLYGITLFGGLSSANCPADGCGTLFALTPPIAPGAGWTETVLYEFSLPNANADTPLVIGRDGALYGFNRPCGIIGCSTSFGDIYRLLPPKSVGGAWEYSILHTFSGTDGGAPASGLTLGSDGTLYGTTFEGGAAGFGTVFSLAPPASRGGSWTETVLYSFARSDGFPQGGVTLGTNGELYGTSEVGGRLRGGGTIFKLAPPASGSGAWTRTLLYSFPIAGRREHCQPGTLLKGSNHTLYGVTRYGGPGPCHPDHIGCGTVFALVP